MQGPLNGVVEVQGGLSGEAGSEVDVADARDPHRVAAAAIDLAQARPPRHCGVPPQRPSSGQEAASLTRPRVRAWIFPTSADTWATYLLPLGGPARRSPNEVKEAPATALF